MPEPVILELKTVDEWIEELEERIARLRKLRQELELRQCPR